MTSKEYLMQAYRLDQKISSDIAESDRLREIAKGISSPTLGERVKTSQPNGAAFTARLDKVIELEEKIDREIDLYVDLKKQMREVIATVENTDEQLVLRYRYIHNYTWERIAMELSVDPRTVRRWHGSALAHLILPMDAIKI